MKYILRSFLAFLLLVTGLATVQATEIVKGNEIPDFSLFKNESKGGGNTLLVFGGIQGDEPGGFHAASLLATRYTIKKGNVWIVPNLNFLSIIKRSRGVYVDLNRKFAAINPQDPEYSLVTRIKSLIVDPQVDVVMNLHDGSGFYRPTYVDKNHNPNKWGQSIIIDQEKIESAKFGELAKIADEMVLSVNDKLDAKKKDGVKDTKTREENMEMSKS